MAIKRPYQMKTISSNLFVIDRKSYQRKKDKDKIAHIVSKWDERIANEPKISARDGKFYVFDGQHTILARESMNGEKPTERLCKVYKGMDSLLAPKQWAVLTRQPITLFFDVTNFFNIIRHLLHRFVKSAFDPFVE